VLGEAEDEEPEFAESAEREGFECFVALAVALDMIFE
jgi:hypothetical protein